MKPRGEAVSPQASKDDADAPPEIILLLKDYERKMKELEASAGAAARKKQAKAAAPAQGGTPGAPGEPKLPPHLASIVDDYESTQEKEASRESVLFRFLNSRNGMLATAGLFGITFYICSALGEVSSDIHLVTAWVLRQLAPERAREALLWFAAHQWLPVDYEKDDPYCRSEPIPNFLLCNPIGVAAGFDTRGEAVSAFMNIGFAFVEVGPVVASEAEAVVARVQESAHQSVFSNLGRLGICVQGTETEMPALVAALAMHSDFLSVLPAAEGEAALTAVARAVMMAKSKLPNGGPPVLLHAPGRTTEDGVMAASVALAVGAEGVILGDDATPNCGAHAAAVSAAWLRTEGKLTIVACGGVRDGRDALALVEAGASLFTISAALLDEGVQACRRLKDELQRLLANKGYASLREATGMKHKEKKKMKKPWSAIQ
eukprot:NODE_8118_length_1522_cov_2.285305.p1 GENE.NODE_8118_length_1522_cov_2.285305~~NODE_8118_length_1522_cov_2.285305.p1  ORF type:complete len:462 (-),score=155.96 NODE_8118_length_1522_cov_2.285305:135-1430(-)